MGSWPAAGCWQLWGGPIPKREVRPKRRVTLPFWAADHSVGSVQRKAGEQKNRPTTCPSRARSSPEPVQCLLVSPEPVCGASRATHSGWNLQAIFVLGPLCGCPGTQLSGPPGEEAQGEETPPPAVLGSGTRGQKKKKKAAFPSRPAASRWLPEGGLQSVGPSRSILNVISAGQALQMRSPSSSLPPGVPTSTTRLRSGQNWVPRD